MTSDHNQRVAVVAGVGPGLGAAIAEAFVQAGYRVAGLSRSDAFGKRMETDLPRGTDVYRHFICDVTHTVAVGHAINTIARDLGAPSVLIYNPMELVIKPFQELSPEEFEAVWRVTCLGAIVTAQALMPHFLKTGQGTIIFNGATAAIKGNPRFTSFASAKFAVRGLAQSLAREFGPKGVHVVHAILDGLIWSPQTQARFNPDRVDCIEPEAIAQTYLHLVAQHRSAWTHELDLRPAHEKF